MENSTKEKVISKKHFNTPIVYGQEFENIDRDKGIIKGVHICCEGEAKGHYINLDRDFIKDVTKLGNEQQTGVKSRFGHPNMSSTTLGTFIGRFHNYRNTYIDRDGIKSLTSIADLHLDESSKKSPNGNLYDYTLELAETNPDMFGSSIAFIEGATKYKKEKTGEKDDKGHDIYKDKPYVTINSLLATDLVDDGAATDRLYSSNSFAERVTLYLDDNPEIYDILSNQPEIVDNFMNHYKTYISNKEQLSLIKNQTIMPEKKDENNIIEVSDQKSFLNSFLNSLVNGIKEAFNKEAFNKETPVAELKTTEDDPRIAEAEEKLETANKEIEKLTAEKIEKLTAEKEAIDAEKTELAKENGDLKTENTKLLAGEVIPLNKQDAGELGELSEYEKGLQKDAQSLQNTMNGK